MSTSNDQYSGSLQDGKFAAEIRPAAPGLSEREEMPVQYSVMLHFLVPAVSRLWFNGLVPDDIRLCATLELETRDLECIMQAGDLVLTPAHVTQDFIFEMDTSQSGLRLPWKNMRVLHLEGVGSGPGPRAKGMLTVCARNVDVLVRFELNHLSHWQVLSASVRKITPMAGYRAENYVYWWDLRSPGFSKPPVPDKLGGLWPWPRSWLGVVGIHNDWRHDSQPTLGQERSRPVLRTVSPPRAVIPTK
jgi:hypothetical protein